MIETRNEEKCHYCDKDGQYTQLVGEDPHFCVALVCKKHLVFDMTS
jgi:hypothetical protein